MGDYDHGDVKVCQGLNHLKNLPGELRVQGRGGFVKKQYLGIQRQCPGNGHTLALAAGQLAWKRFFLVLQPHLPEQCPGFLIYLRLIPFLHMNGSVRDVLHDRIMGEQVEILEYQAILALNFL